MSSFEKPSKSNEEQHTTDSEATDTNETGTQPKVVLPHTDGPVPVSEAVEHLAAEQQAMQPAEADGDLEAVVAQLEQHTDRIEALEERVESLHDRLNDVEYVTDVLAVASDVEADDGECVKCGGELAVDEPWSLNDQRAVRCTDCGEIAAALQE